MFSQKTVAKCSLTRRLWSSRQCISSASPTMSISWFQHHWRESCYFLKIRPTLLLRRLLARRPMLTPGGRLSLFAPAADLPFFADLLSSCFERAPPLRGLLGFSRAATTQVHVLIWRHEVYAIVWQSYHLRRCPGQLASSTCSVVYKWRNLNEDFMQIKEKKIFWIRP